MKMWIEVILNKVQKHYRIAVSRLLFYIRGKSKQNNNRIRALKNIHVGERAFIICNGPSLTASDLETIHNNGDISFACNKIDKIFMKTNWRPTYYVVLDETFQYSLIDTMNRVTSNMKFFSKDSFLKTRNVSGVVSYISTIGSRDLLNEPKFSEDLLSGIYTIGTTTYSMIQLAVYMGINEIYIIGCDNTYAKEIRKDGVIVSNGVNSYFDSANPKDQATAAATWQMNIAYENARKYAEKHGIQIFNATRGGCLECFHRVDFDELFR